MRLLLSGKISKIILHDVTIASYGDRFEKGELSHHQAHPEADDHEHEELEEETVEEEEMEYSLLDSLGIKEIKVGKI
jgi:hypothetical protein